jgi:hypothetical protein
MTIVPKPHPDYPENLTMHIEALYKHYGMHTLLMELEAICCDNEERLKPELATLYRAAGDHIRAAMAEVIKDE